MKKRNFFFAAFMAVTLAFGFTSCSSSDDDPIIIDPTIKETIKDEILKLPIDVLDAPQADGAVEKYTIESAPIESVILTKSDKAIVKINPLTKAFNDNVIVCNYTVEGTNIVIKAGKYTIKVNMLDVANIIIDDQPYSCTTEELPEPTEANEISLCREWKEAKYTASLYFDKLPVWGAKTEEKKELSDIRELNNKVITKLIKDSNLRDEGFKMISNNLTGVNFVSNGTVYFTYQDGKIEESTWKWKDKKNAKLTTTLDGKEVTIDIRFKKGASADKVNTVYFIIDTKIEGVGGLGVHELTGQLICKMTD